MTSGELELTDYRRTVSELYAAVRAEDDPQAATSCGGAAGTSCSGRIRRARCRRAIRCARRACRTGPTTPGCVSSCLCSRPNEELSLSVPTSDGVIPMDRIGCLRLPAPLDAVIDVWWLRQYAGGLLLPLRDGTAGQSSYGGGRYALDTAKGADLGGRDGSLVVDLNFLYHPSCRYNDAWQCPLAPPGNTIAAPVSAGERL